MRDGKAIEKPGKPSLTVWERPQVRVLSHAQTLHGEISRHAWRKISQIWAHAAGAARLNAPSMNLLGLNRANYKLRLTEKLHVRPASGGCM